MVVTEATSRYCAVRAFTDAADPRGHAPAFAQLAIVEVPLPWGSDLYEHRPGGRLFQRLRGVFLPAYQAAGGLAAYEAGTAPLLLGVAPDAEWSTPGVTRVWLVGRPQSAFSEFNIDQYLMPSNLEDDIVHLVQAFYEGRRVPLATFLFAHTAWWTVAAAPWVSPRMSTSGSGGVAVSGPGARCTLVGIASPQP